MNVRKLAALGIVLLSGCSNPFLSVGIFNSNDYLPIDPDTTWYYKYMNPDDDTQNTTKAAWIGESMSGGKIPFFLFNENFALNFGYCARTSDKLIGNYGTKYPLELPWPPQEGKTWSYKSGAGATDNLDMKYADKRQDVEVPYGKFSGTQCLIVSKDGKDYFKYYFAAGIGIVKAEERTDAAKAFHTFELINYRIGKIPVPVLGSTTTETTTSSN